MPLRRDDAIVLARYPFRERDLVVVLLTRESGQVRVVARRSRGLHGSSGGALEPLAGVKVSYFETPRSELARLDEVRLERSSFDIAVGPRAWAAGHVIAELALVFCPAGERQEKSFRLVERCLRALSAGIAPGIVATYGQLWFLRLAGLLPDLSSCGACGAVIPDTTRFYDEQESCFVCQRHRPARAVVLDSSSVGWIVRAQMSPVEQMADVPPAAVGAWLDALLGRNTDKDLPARRYFTRTCSDPLSE